LSALATPWLLPIALVAAALLGRVRLAWWAVPVFWPYTQWYYSSLVLPVVTPLAAIALSMPVRGATTLAIVAAVAEIAWARRAAAATRVTDRATERASEPGGRADFQ
jgi:hypothetical protein